MFKDGPIPPFLHGLAEYVLGGLFIALPLLLGYESGAATAVSIALGIVMIAVAASTDWNLSINNQIPKAAHFVLDWVIAAVAIASPFLFGFSGETDPTAIFLAAGVLHIVLTIGTRFGPKGDRQAAEPPPDERLSHETPATGPEQAPVAPPPATGGAPSRR